MANMVSLGKKLFRGVAFAGITVVSLSLLACGKTSGNQKVENVDAVSNERYALGTETETICRLESNLMAEGAFCWNDQALSYIDVKSGTEYLMCYDPTCDHKWRKEGSGFHSGWGTSCTALLHGRGLMGSRMIGDWFYMVKDVPNDFEKVNIVRSRMDQTDPVVLATLDIQDSIRDACWYKDDFLLLAYWNLKVSEPDETGNTETESCTSGIIQFSVKDSKVTKLVEWEENGQQGIISNLYCDGESVFYSYEFGTDSGTVETQTRCVNLSSHEDILLCKIDGTILGVDSEKVLYYARKQTSMGMDGEAKLYVRKWNEEPVLLAEKAEYYTGLICGSRILFTANEGKHTVIYSYEQSTEMLEKYMETTGLELHLEAAFPDIVYLKGQGSGVPYSTLYVNMEDLIAGRVSEIKQLYRYNQDSDRYYER